MPLTRSAGSRPPITGARGDGAQHASEEGQAPAHAADRIAVADRPGHPHGGDRAERGRAGHGPVGLDAGEKRHGRVKSEDRQREGHTEADRGAVRVSPRRAHEGQHREQQHPAAHRDLEGDELEGPPEGPVPAGVGVAARRVKVAEQMTPGRPVVVGVPEKDRQQAERGDRAGRRDGAEADRGAFSPGGPQGQQDAGEDQEDGVLKEEAQSDGCAEAQPGPA
jgi:hypothetical protein